MLSLVCLTWLSFETLKGISEDTFQQSVSKMKNKPKQKSKQTTSPFSPTFITLFSKENLEAMA